MKARVDQETCIGCGLCPDICPDVFAMDDNNKAETIVSTVAEKDESCAQEAAESCPVDAITIEK